MGSSSTSLDYLQEYVTNDEIVDLGTIKEADMEAVMSCEPFLLYTSRLSRYDLISDSGISSSFNKVMISKSSSCEME